jgi:hypothetical protein
LGIIFALSRSRSSGADDPHPFFVKRAAIDKNDEHDCYKTDRPNGASPLFAVDNAAIIHNESGIVPNPLRLVERDPMLVMV